MYLQLGAWQSTNTSEAQPVGVCRTCSVFVACALGGSAEYAAEYLIQIVSNHMKHVVSCGYNLIKLFEHMTLFLKCLECFIMHFSIFNLLSFLPDWLVIALFLWMSHFMYNLNTHINLLSGDNLWRKGHYHVTKSVTDLLTHTIHIT